MDAECPAVPASFVPRCYRNINNYRNGLNNYINVENYRPLVLLLSLVHEYTTRNVGNSKLIDILSNLTPGINLDSAGKIGLWSHNGNKN